MRKIITKMETEILGIFYVLQLVAVFFAGCSFALIAECGFFKETIGMAILSVILFVLTWLSIHGMKDSLVRVDIVDNDCEKQSERIMDTYYLFNPDNEKLRELEAMLANRYEQEEPCINDYTCIHEFMKSNFKILNVESQEIHW